MLLAKTTSTRLFSFVLLPAVALFAVQLSGCTKRAVPPPPPGGAYRSVNAGASFDQSVTLAGQEGSYIARYSLGSIHRDPKKPDTIYMAAADNGIVVSSDDGQSWQQVATPLALTSDVVLLDNGTIVASGVGQDNQGYIVRSVDQGKSWQTVHTVPVPVRKSLNNFLFGSSPRASIITALAIDPFHPDRVYATSTLGSIFVGEQSAKVWRTFYTLAASNTTNGSADSLALRTITPSPVRDGELLVITNDNRLLRIRDGISERLRIPRKGETTLQQSYDSGRRVFDAIYVPNSSGSLFVGTGTGALVSRNDGKTWQELQVPVETNVTFNTVVVSVSPTNLNRLFVAVNDALYRSEDGGKTWNTYSLELGQFVISSLSIHPANAAHVLLVTAPKKT